MLKFEDDPELFLPVFTELKMLKFEDDPELFLPVFTELGMLKFQDDLELFFLPWAHHANRLVFH